MIIMQLSYMQLSYVTHVRLVYLMYISTRYNHEYRYKTVFALLGCRSPYINRFLRKWRYDIIGLCQRI